MFLGWKKGKGQLLYVADFCDCLHVVEFGF